MRLDTLSHRRPWGTDSRILCSGPPMQVSVSRGPWDMDNRLARAVRMSHFSGSCFGDAIGLDAKSTLHHRRRAEPQRRLGTVAPLA